MSSLSLSLVMLSPVDLLVSFLLMAELFVLVSFSDVVPLFSSMFSHDDVQGEPHLRVL